MLIALVNDQRAPANPKLKGLCPVCQQPVTAKCGERRAWHWAHLTKKECDSWWEETEWHRFWKNQFPLEWQEVIQYDHQSGEKHVADVRTKHGLVVEFQHSPLAPQELVKREAFYKNMIWVVDASYRTNDYKRFVKGQYLKTDRTGAFLVPFPEKCFPTNWIQSDKPVFFDFKGLAPSSDPPENQREILWCLLPRLPSKPAVLVAFSRTDIVKEATESDDLVKVLLNVREALLKPHRHPLPSNPTHPPPIRRHPRL